MDTPPTDKPDSTGLTTAIVLSVAGLALIAATVYLWYILPSHTDPMRSYFLFYKRGHDLTMMLAGLFKLIAPVFWLICGAALTFSVLTFKLSPTLFQVLGYTSLLGVFVTKIFSILWLAGSHKFTLQWLQAHDKNANISPVVLNAFAMKLQAKVLVGDIATALLAAVLVLFLFSRVSRRPAAVAQPIDQ